jgi:hypothetical protein
MRRPNQSDRSNVSCGPEGHVQRSRSWPQGRFRSRRGGPLGSLFLRLRWPSGARNSVYLGSLLLPSPLPQMSLGTSTTPLRSHARARRLVSCTCHEFARPARRAARANEGLQVSGKNGPHAANFDSVQSLPQQQPAHVGLRCLELGSSLGDRQQAWALDREILARDRNHFCYSARYRRSPPPSCPSGKGHTGTLGV